MENPCRQERKLFVGLVGETQGKRWQSHAVSTTRWGNWTRFRRHAWVSAAKKHHAEVVTPPKLNEWKLKMIASNVSTPFVGVT